MNYGCTAGKKIKLHVDISGNYNQEQIIGLLDSVESDDELDIGTLLNDSDTEFSPASADAVDSIRHIELEPSLSRSHIEAVIHDEIVSGSPTAEPGSPTGSPTVEPRLVIRNVASRTSV